MALEPTDFLELLFVRRLAIPPAIAVVIGIGVYFFSGKTPAAAVVAFGIGTIGLAIGIIWHIAGGSKPGSA